MIVHVSIGSVHATSFWTIVLKSVNIMLLCAACASSIYCIHVYKESRTDLPGPNWLNPGIEAGIPGKVTVKWKAIMPLKDYTQSLRKDPFKDLDSSTDNPPPPPPVPKEPLLPIKLTGIILDEHPQAVFEDWQTGETAFVPLNQSIHGATLIDIQEERLLLQLDGITVEKSIP